MSNSIYHSEFYKLTIERFNILELVGTSLHQGWDHVWFGFAEQLTKFSNQESEERGLFIDVFCHYCLEKIAVHSSGDLLLSIIAQWYQHRQLPPRCGGLSRPALQISYLWCNTMREKLHQYLAVTPFEQLAHIQPSQQVLLVNVWRAVFFNSFSSLHLYVPTEQETALEAEQLLSSCQRHKLYPNAIIASMYAPYSADGIALNVYKLWDSPSIPLWCKAILAIWLFAVPYFNGIEQHRHKVLNFVTDFCQAAINNPHYMSHALFKILSEEIMGALWRVSYLGGNHGEEISAFGDFMHFYMNRMFPHFQKMNFKRRLKSPDQPLRIGYVSRLFANQAVSFYMMNRILHHDQGKFEVYTFAIDAKQNKMTDMAKQCSEKFIPIQIPSGFVEIGKIAETLVNSKLDILIYPDIGMDVITYYLAALQLAPIQCALVGHGTTTGLPTIQHYISGDFEPIHAQFHYREKLIRLANLGAAQLVPSQPDRWLTRNDFNLPEDAVIFVSCANGIKHGSNRDRVLVEILQQAPNALIVLKPFMNGTNIDNNLNIRLKGAARKAGVEQRLIILPPLGQSSDLLSLLSVADIQLDTYPYGGWTTNMEALYMGLPIVTQEGKMARNRWGAAMLRAMNIEEGIARNEEEYIGWAVRYAQDASLRCKVRGQITVRVTDVLFNGSKAQACYEQELTRIYQDEFSI